jgi:hypothetical protein
MAGGLASPIAGSAILIGLLLPGMREAPEGLLHRLATRAGEDIAPGIIGDVTALRHPVPSLRPEISNTGKWAAIPRCRSSQSSMTPEPQAVSAISRLGAMPEVPFARSIRAAPIRPRPAGSTGGFHVGDHAIACVGQMVGGTGKIGRSPRRLIARPDRTARWPSARPGSLASSRVSRCALTARGASAGSMLSGCLSNLGFGLHDTGICGVALAAGQALCEKVPRPGRSDRGAEPAAGGVELNLLAGAALGPFDALARLHVRLSAHEATGQQHPDQQFRINWRNCGKAPGAAGCLPGRRIAQPI